MVFSSSAQLFIIVVKQCIFTPQPLFTTKNQYSNQTCLVDINGAFVSSGVWIPTLFLDAYFAVVVPYLIHYLGNALLAVRMKVYCIFSILVFLSQSISYESLFFLPINQVHCFLAFPSLISCQNQVLLFPESKNLDEKNELFCFEISSKPVIDIYACIG